MDSQDNPAPLEVQVGQQLTARGLTFAAAESCTGGLIMHRMTNVPGSSAYVLGGIVAYADAAKIKLLGVAPSTLATVGAVSEQSAREMVLGVCQALGADVGVSVTGIAGPGGGTPAKPVGLTFIGVATPEGVQVARYVWSGDRDQNKSSSAEAALRLLLDALAG